MKNKGLILILIFVIVVGMVSHSVLAEEAQELSRETMLDRLNSVFLYNLDIRSGIQGISEEKIGGGTVFLFNGVPLKQLDDGTLLDLVRTVNGQLSMKNIQRQEKQMRNLRQIENVNKLDKQQRQIKQLQQ